MNRGINFDSSFLRHYHLDDFLTVPLTNEELVVPKSLADSIDKCVGQVPKKGLMRENNKALVELISAVKASKEALSKFVSSDVQIKAVQQQLTAMFESPLAKEQTTTETTQAKKAQAPETSGAGLAVVDEASAKHLEPEEEKKQETTVLKSQLSSGHMYRPKPQVTSTGSIDLRKPRQ